MNRATKIIAELLIVAALGGLYGYYLSDDALEQTMETNK